jgi:hypothetical protein
MTGPGAATPGAPGPDPLGLVFGALGFGLSLGVAFQGLVTWGVRTLQGGPPTAPPGLGAPPAVLLLGGTFAAIVGAGLATWTLLIPIRNPWRQAMLAVVAGVGSFVLSLVSIPLDRAFGRPGLLVPVAAGALGCLVIGRGLSRARRST